MFSSIVDTLKFFAPFALQDNYLTPLVYLELTELQLYRPLFCRGTSVVAGVEDL